MATARIASFREFWPYYLGEHRHRVNRKLHALGTTLALGTAGLAAATETPLLVPLALVCGYGPAWVGHFFFERNRPATFTYPRWSLIADFKMYGLVLSGRLDAELTAHGITSRDA